MLFAWGYRDEKGRYKPLKYPTGQSINPKAWDGQRTTGPYSAHINNELDKVKTEAVSIFLSLRDDDLTPAILKSELDIKLGRVEAKAVPVRKNEYVSEYIDKYIADIVSGDRMTFKDPTKKFAPGTIRNFKSFRSKFNDYVVESGKHYTFRDIDIVFYRHFSAWLKKLHTTNSTGKTIKQLKMLMQAAFDDDVHTNLNFKKKWFKVVSELVDTIYLDEHEIELLHNYNTSGGHEKARDMFMVGYHTAQRISDWYKINDQNIKTTVNGVPVIKIRQQKTGTQVSIPFIDPRLIALLENYNYQLPKISKDKVNRYIKIVCKKAGISSEKAIKVTSHTARRSACTNMYNARIPIGKIMKISGHKTESEFKKYIRVTDDEVTEDLSTHPFYTRE